MSSLFRLKIFVYLYFVCVRVKNDSVLGISRNNVSYIITSLLFEFLQYLLVALKCYLIDRFRNCFHIIYLTQHTLFVSGLNLPEVIAPIR